MTSPQRMVDPDHPPHDVRFVDNNLECEYRWTDEDATVAATTAAVGAAVRVLATLFAPDRFAVVVASFPWDSPHELGPHRAWRPDALSGTADAYDEVVRAALAATPPPEDGTGIGVSGVSPHSDGWVRIAVPPGADTDPPWNLVCADGFHRRGHLRPAGPLHGEPTAWMRIENARSCSWFQVDVDATGCARASLQLGPAFYQPLDGLRPPERTVRGVPLAEWQRCNRALLDGTGRRLHELGWVLDERR